VSTVKLKKKWKEESQDWDKNGDPAADSSLDIDIESKELAEKEIARKKLEDLLEKSYFELIKELTGVDPVALGFGGAGTVVGAGALINAVAKKHGKQVAREVAEALADEMKEKTSDILHSSGRHFKIKPKPKDIARGLGKKLGKKLGTAAGGVGLVLTVLTIAGVVAILLKLREYEKKLKILQRALRWEALRLDPNIDPETITYWYRPPESTAKALGEASRCVLFLKIEYRWRDTKTGKVEKKSLPEKRVTGHDRGAWKVELPAGLPAAACFAEAVMTWIMHCKTDPPSVNVVFTGVYPIRTSANCSKHRGKIIE